MPSTRTALGNRRVDLRTVSDDGYVRVRPAWPDAGVQQMDAGGFGRITGWLLGALFGAPLLLAISESLAFWQIVLGCATTSAIGATVGHFVAKAVWARVLPAAMGTNPRTVDALALRPGDWLLMRHDGRDRALQVMTLPDYTTGDPTADDAMVEFQTSAARRLVLPANQLMTLVDLPQLTESYLPNSGPR